jgi:hypothetical protein
VATFPARKGETVGEDEANRWALSIKEREREKGMRGWAGPVLRSAQWLPFFVITFSFLFSGLLYNFFI